jgi:GMP synthase-like glutamine amidotransferase
MIIIVDMNYKMNSLGYYEFVKPILSIAGKSQNCDVSHFSKLKSIEKYEKIILTGTTLMDFTYINGNFEWIKKINASVLGICAGMQVIGKAYGSELIKSTEIGMTQIKTIKKNSFFSGAFSAFELHNKT